MLSISQAVSMGIFIALVLWFTDYLPAKVRLRYSLKVILMSLIVELPIFFLISFSQSSLVFSIVVAVVTSFLLFILRILRAWKDEVLQWDIKPIPERFRR